MRSYRGLTTVLLVAAISMTAVVAANAGSSQVGTSSLSQRHVFTSESRVGAGSMPTAVVSTSAPVPTGRVLVRLKGSATPQTLSSIARSADTTAGGVSDVMHGRMQWRVPKGRSAEKFARDLQASGKVVYAVPDYRRYLAYTPPAYVSPNDPAFTSATGYTSNGVFAETYAQGYSWWLRDVRAPQAWQEGYTGADVIGKYPLRTDGTSFTVAVLDTGLYLSHPDVGIDITGGVDFFDHEDSNGDIVKDNDVSPVNPSAMPSSTTLLQRREQAAHGTCVAGEIGATANNALGTVGVGYDTQVVVHKVMGIERNGDVAIRDAAVLDAIMYSVDTGAKVINMSFGGSDYSTALADGVNYAHEHNVVVVAAKGNNTSGGLYYPACNDHVLSVGALDKNAQGVTVPASFTNYRSTSLQVMAPGVFVFGLSEPGWDAGQIAGVHTPGYFIWNGTSMSSPIVAGAIAWLWRAAPALSATEIQDDVLASASVHGAAHHFPNGYRELDMYAAYKKLEADYPLLAKPGLAEQTVSTLGDVTVEWGTPLTAQRGVTYDVAVNGSVLESATTATGGSYPWGPGEYTLTAAAHSTYNWGDGTATSTATVQVLGLASGASSWSVGHAAGSSATALTIGYHQTVGIESVLRDASGTPLAGAVPVLQASTDNVTFATVGGTAELPSGVYRSYGAPENRTYYRLAFETTGGVVGSVSSAVAVTPEISLGTPSSKSSISHTKRLSVTGKLRPAHSTSSRVVRLKLRRLVNHRWVSYATVWTRATYHGSYSSYSASLKLRRGKYRIYADAPADSKHAQTTSAYRSVTVK